MVGLLDIAPSNRTVTISAGEIDVPGLTINAVVTIIKKRPELLELLQNGQASLTFDQIMDMGLDVAATFLAAGLGYPGNEEAEQRCKALKPEDAFDLGHAIMEESFPKGPKSFFDKVTKALSAAGVNLKLQTEDSLNSSQKPVNA